MPSLSQILRNSRPPAVLALADGSIYRGWGFGAQTCAEGEVVFNTCMTGYQEVLTDASYFRQIVVMTPVQIGNTGVNRNDEESAKPWVSGFVVRDSSPLVSSWRAENGLDHYLAGHGIPAVDGIDTRALTRHIRDKGAQAGVIGVGSELRVDDLVDRARAWGSIEGRDLARDVTSKGTSTWREGPFHPLTGFKTTDERYRVVAVDFGIKKNILRQLAGAGCRVLSVPADTDAQSILRLDPDGVLLSNGPGDPEPLTYAVRTVRHLLGRVPVFGICLGHQILGLALGGRTHKLKFGHHGGNHPVKRLSTGEVEITSQNHGFVVDSGTLLKARRNTEVTHINLNDGTVEGIRCRDIPAFSVQYHPEASPGPHDARYLFAHFTAMMDQHRGG